MHVAIINEGLPFPLQSGKCIRSFNLAVRLAKRHRITYVTHRKADPEETLAAETHLRDHGIEVALVDHHVPRDAGPAFYVRLAANLLSPLPYSVQRHRSPSLKAAVQQLNATETVDLWHVEWTPYARCLPCGRHAPRVVMAHNVESLIWQRYHETESNPIKRWYIGRQLKKFLRFEREVFCKADELIVVSDADAELAKRSFGATRVSVVSNGVDVEHFTPTSEPRNPNSILFVGASSGVRTSTLSKCFCTRCSPEWFWRNRPPNSISSGAIRRTGSAGRWLVVPARRCTPTCPMSCHSSGTPA